MQSSCAPPSRTVHLDAFRVPVFIRVAGNRAHKAESAIRAAWHWCLTPTLSPDLSREKPLDLEVTLDDDPAVVAGAALGGAVAGNDLAAVMHALSPAVTVAAIPTAPAHRRM